MYLVFAYNIYDAFGGMEDCLFSGNCYQESKEEYLKIINNVGVKFDRVELWHVGSKGTINKLEWFER